MDTIDISPVVQILMAVITFMITTFLIPYFKKKTDNEHIDLFMRYVETAVLAAEQLFGKDEGEQKKEYVITFLEKYFVIDADVMEKAVEGMVKRVHASLESTEEGVSYASRR